MKSNLKFGDMLKMKIPGSVALIIGLAIAASPLFAHHGDAAYSSTPLVLKGCVVTEFDWMNPHSLIKFDYKNEKGEVQKWTMEIGSPPSMQLLGWSRNTLHFGDVITAYVYQSKTGAFVGRTNKVILADGTILADRDDSTPSRYSDEKK
jgi:Family of unknown function (DUF6152)